jgi:hypothetical protein
MVTSQECVGMYYVTSTGEPDHWAERKWKNPPMNFDNTGTALLTLFEIAGLELWMTPMYSAMDATDLGRQPIRNHNKFACFYFLVFILFGSFLVSRHTLHTHSYFSISSSFPFPPSYPISLSHHVSAKVMNLFVGAVVDNFNRQTKKDQQADENPYKNLPAGLANLPPGANAANSGSYSDGTKSQERSSSRDKSEKSSGEVRHICGDDTNIYALFFFLYIFSRDVPHIIMHSHATTTTNPLPPP